MSETKTLDHEQFLQQYILNRCLGHTGGLEGASATRQAEEASRRGR